MITGSRYLTSCSHFTVPTSTLLGVFHNSPALHEVILVDIIFAQDDWRRAKLCYMQKLDRFTIINMACEDELYLIDHVDFPSHSTLVLSGTISNFMHETVLVNGVSHSDVMSRLKKRYTQLDIRKDVLRLMAHPADAFNLVMEAKFNIPALSSPLPITLSNYDISTVHTLDLSDDFTTSGCRIDLDSVVQRLMALRNIRLFTPLAVIQLMPKLARALEDKPRCCPSLEHLWLMDLDLDAEGMVKQVTEFVAMCARSRRGLKILHLCHCNISTGNYARLLGGVGDSKLVRSGSLW